MIMEGTAWVIRTPDQTKRLSYLIDARLQNGPLMVEVKPYAPPKTRRQRGYLHAMIREVALALGVHEADLKADLKAQFGVVTVEPSLVTGERVARVMPTERYSREQMSALIHSISAWAAEKGVTVTEPDDPNTREELGLDYLRVQHREAREAVRSMRA
jgi:hypothetical protein